jgi:hypothetical protein
MRMPFTNKLYQLVVIAFATGLQKVGGFLNK